MDNLFKVIYKIRTLTIYELVTERAIIAFDYASGFSMVLEFYTFIVLCVCVCQIYVNLFIVFFCYVVGVCFFMVVHIFF